MWGGLLIHTGHQQKVTALDNFRTSRKADRPSAGCRATDAREECWHVFYDDVRVGSIAIRAGNPDDTDPWQWYCCFYPGRIRRSARPAPRPRSTRREPLSRALGACFYPTEPRPIFRRGETIGIGPRGNTRCGMPARDLSRPAMDRPNPAAAS
jgi:hypothetical protein